MKNKLLALLLCSWASFSQTNYWNTAEKSPSIKKENLLDRKNYPSEYKLLKIDFQRLKTELFKAANANATQGVEVYLPNINGKIELYEVFYTPVMDEELSELYPEIKSFKAVNKKEAANVVSISISPYFGMHLMGTDANGETYYIDSYTKDFNTYILYSRKNIKDDKRTFRCLNHPTTLTDEEHNHIAPFTVNHGRFKSYRLAVACTAEYGNFHLQQAGQQYASAQVKRATILAAINTTFTRVNFVYERDLSSRLVLVNGSQHLLNYGNIEDDGLNNDDALALIEQGSEKIVDELGLSAFDIGHTLSTGAGGLASVRSLCSNNQDSGGYYVKAQGITGSEAPVNDPFDIDYVCHEIGHQFGGNHTFAASQGGSCQGNNNNFTAVEPGGGTTIMGYAGICETMNIELNSSPYFHAVSIWEINSHLSNINCGVVLNASNPAPVINQPDEYFIPKGTPFALTASATDANNPNSITYNWEQADNGISVQPPVAHATNGAVFRSFSPSNSATRVFPKMETILNGSNNSTGIVTSKWEQMPNVARSMNFIFSARDNNAFGGQVSWGITKVQTTAQGPFVITQPNNLSAGSAPVWNTANSTTQTIKWNVANTNQPPVNTQLVKISYSTDNGNTFVTLLESTPNDGEEVVNVPLVNTTNARIKIEAVGNIYFTISKKFKIVHDAASTQNFAIDNVSIYPNPTRDKVTIAFNANSPHNAKLTITNLMGQKVMEQDITEKGWVEKTVDVSHLSKGLYLINIKADGVNISEKLIVK